MTSSLLERIDLFRSLHSRERPLALANVWDVASAVIAQGAGAPALATTSAGVAWSLRCPDGDHLDRERAVARVAAIVDAVTVPVSADIEGGYSDSADGVAATTGALIEAGAVGLNIEDGDRPPADLALRISAARRVAAQVSVPIFINARTDVFLAGIGTLETRLEETVDRARRYADAGADGIFVPGVTDPETIAALTAAIDLPLNIMAAPGAPSVTMMGRLGVARVSLGSGVAQTAYASVQRSTVELLEHGTYDSVAGALDFGDLNRLMVCR